MFCNQINLEQNRNLYRVNKLAWQGLQSACKVISAGGWNSVKLAYWENKTISHGGITVDFWIIKVQTSN